MTAAAPPASAYREALFEARRTMFRLDAVAARRISEALRGFADELARRLAGGSASEAARQSERIVRAAAARLEASIASAVALGQRLGFRDTLAVWREATEAVAAVAGVPDAALGAIRTPPATLLAAFESGGGRAQTWRTLLSGHVANAATEANALVREALARDVGPEELARRLRRYVVGAEELAEAFPDLNPDDLRGVPRDALGAARRMRYNAERIAFTEIHNARAEAEVQHFAADPLVRAVRWTLSPDRGRVRTPDACDVLAKTDFYGLGAGVYPVRKVPVSPHPFDRCERVPVTRTGKEVSEPKPRGRFRSRPDGVTIPDAERLSPLAAGRIRREVEAALRVPAIGGRRLPIGAADIPLAPGPASAVVDPGPPRFVPAGSIAEAEAFARRVGVRVADFGSERPDIADGIAGVLEDLVRRGLPVAPEIYLGATKARQYLAARDMPHTSGFYVPSQRIIVFNAAGTWWRDMVGSARQAYAVGFGSTEHPFHVIRHEMGHYVHHARVGRLQPYGSPIPASRVTARMVQEVGRYGMGEQSEFVAEVFSALLDGRILSAETMALYRELGGPIP